MSLSLEKMSTKDTEHIEGVFFDIDDTFTTRGKIHATAFSALWRLKDNGFRLVPITGRPAGWCDHIARMWPVDGIVGENGAFYFWYDELRGRLEKRFMDDAGVRESKRNHLIKVREEILASVPGTAAASDQSYREADLAIDYCEDVPPIEWESVKKICDIFKKYGGECKVSSVHVNGWFGRYDKLAMTKIFARERWRVDLDDDKDKYLFCGDSPNDEPMFKYFPRSVGVRNVERFADLMEYMPAFVTRKEGGEGFAEMAHALISLKHGGV